MTCFHVVPSTYVQAYNNIILCHRPVICRCHHIRSSRIINSANDIISVSSSYLLSKTCLLDVKTCARFELYTVNEISIMLKQSLKNLLRFKQLKHVFNCFSISLRITIHL